MSIISTSQWSWQGQSEVQKGELLSSSPVVTRFSLQLCLCFPYTISDRVEKTSYYSCFADKELNQTVTKWLALG